MNNFNPHTFHMRCRIKVLGMAVVACLFPAQAADRDTTREQRMETWREGRFGMFVHWGPYAVAAGEYQGKAVPHIGALPVDQRKATNPTLHQEGGPQDPRRRIFYP